MNIVRDNDDIVIVTLNYRLNIFGQPNAPQLVSSSQSQNFGLLDRQAAIEWVHENIAAFGGDPNRIVLFGESAGSFSADAYMYANPTDTIVKGETCFELPFLIFIEFSCKVSSKSLGGTFKLRFKLSTDR